MASPRSLSLLALIATIAAVLTGRAESQPYRPGRSLSLFRLRPER